jgi:hypothetical protein
MNRPPQCVTNTFMDFTLEDNPYIVIIIYIARPDSFQIIWLLGEAEGVRPCRLRFVTRHPRSQIAFRPHLEHSRSISSQTSQSSSLHRDLGSSRPTVPALVGWSARVGPRHARNRNRKRIAPPFALAVHPRVPPHLCAYLHFIHPCGLICARAHQPYLSCAALCLLGRGQVEDAERVDAARVAIEHEHTGG